MGIKYPRMKREQKRNTKLSDKDCKEIISLRKYGCTYAEIGYVFRISQMTAWTICNPEKWKENYDKQNAIKVKACKLSPKCKRKTSRQVLKSFAYKNTLDDRLREYRKKIAKRQYANRKK